MTASTPKKIGVQYDHQKIPILNIVVQTAASAPSSPVDGQAYYDTVALRTYFRENGAWALASQTGSELLANKGAASGYTPLNSSSLVAITYLPVASSGTSSSTLIVRADDSRLSDTRTPTDASVTGGTAGSGVKIAANTITAANIANGTITDTQVASANKDGTTSTPSLRTLGTGSTQALAGNTRLDQITAPTAAVTFNSQELTNLGAPLSPSSAARLQDIQAASAGIDNKPSARIVLTTNNALSGLSAQDGVTPVDGDRVLATGQTTASQNGIWLTHSGAWTRADDTITAGAFWLVTEGTAGAGTQWKVATPDPIVVGTTALTINPWGATSSYTGTTNRITISSGAIDISSSYVGQTSITTLGTITTGTWTGTSIAIANGGTGATTAAAARHNLGTLAAYAANLPALTAGVEQTVTHSLGSADVLPPSFIIVADGTSVDFGWRVIDSNTVGVTTDTAGGYSASAVRISLAAVA